MKTLMKVYLFLHRMARNAAAGINIPSVSFEWESPKGVHQVTLQCVNYCGWGMAAGIDAKDGFATRIWTWPWDGGVYAWSAAEVIRQTFMQCCMEAKARFSIPEHVLFSAAGKQALSIILADALDSERARNYAEAAVASKNCIAGEAEFLIGDFPEKVVSVDPGDTADQYLKEREKKYRLFTGSRAGEETNDKNLKIKDLKKEKELVKASKDVAFQEGQWDLWSTQGRRLRAIEEELADLDWSEAEEEEEKKVRQVTADAVKAYALKKNLEGQVERLRKSRNEMYRISAWEEWEKLGQMIREIDSKIAELE